MPDHRRAKCLKSLVADLGRSRYVQLQVPHKARETIHKLPPVASGQSFLHHGTPPRYDSNNLLLGIAFHTMSARLLERWLSG